MTERLAVKIAQDKSHAELLFLPASGVSGSMKLLPEQLLRLIQQLGSIHAQLVAEKEVPVLEGEQINAVFDTRWYVQPELLGEASVISFQHPAFGPLGFAIPIDQVAYLVSLLSNQVQEAEQLRSRPQ